MKLINKTRYAILGMLIEAPRTGYEMKSLMGRSTVYFWRESDSTIYPMLKVLAEEGKVLSCASIQERKGKRCFPLQIREGQNFKAWLESPTGSGNSAQ